MFCNLILADCDKAVIFHINLRDCRECETLQPTCVIRGVVLPVSCQQESAQSLGSPFTRSLLLFLCLGFAGWRVILLLNTIWTF